MRFTPVLVFHICVGILGLLSGTTALSFRKGSGRHRMSGNIFVVSMLSLGASGAYLGFTKHQTLNGLMGVLTFYLRSEEHTSELQSLRHLVCRLLLENNNAPSRSNIS